MKSETRRGLLRIARIWGCLNVVGLAVVFVWSPEVADSDEVMLLVLLSSLVQLLALSLLGRHVRPGGKRIGPPVDEELRQLEQLADGWIEPIFDYTPMAKLLLQPRRYHLRLSERLAITRDGLKWEQVSTSRMPSGSSDGVRPLPLLWVVKGTLLNELEVTDATGKSMAVAPYETSLRLVVQVWRQLARTQFRLLQRDNWDVDEEHFHSAFRDGVGVIAATIKNDDRTDQQSLRRSRDRLLEDWKARNPEFAKGDAALKGVAFRFLWQFACDYLVVAFDEGSGRISNVSLRYSMDFEHRVGARTSGRERSKGNLSFAHRVARAMGRFPPVLQFDLEQAYTTKSYHLQINLPRGDHFADGSVLDAAGQRIRRRRLGRFAVDQPYFRRSRLGSSRLHLYTRSFGSSPERHAVLYLRIQESPWRTLGGSVLFATVASSLLWMLISWNGSGDASSLVATVIGLPIALAGAVFAFRSPLRREGLAMSVAGSAIYLIAGGLLLAGVFGVLDQDGRWAAQLAEQFDSAFDTPAQSWLDWPPHATVLRTIGRLLVLTTVVAWATLFVRAVAWLSHYRSDWLERR